MTAWPETAEYGPGAARRGAWAVFSVLLLGGVTATALLVPRSALIALLPVLPLAPVMIAGLSGRVLPPTGVTPDGIRCHPVAAVPVLRREFIPWTAIASVDARQRGLRSFVVLHLTDGSRVVLRHPSGRRGDRAVQNAVELMRWRHLAACDGTLPRVDRVPLPWRRVRVPVRVLAAVLPVVSAIGLVTWLVTNSRAMTAPDAVTACDLVPRQAAARVLPDGAVQGYGNQAACRWSTATPAENGTWIDFHVTSWAPLDAERSYRETLGAVRAAGRAPRFFRDGDAYTVAWRDAWGFTAHGRAHVKGYLVMVALHSRRTASARDAERAAGDVLRAVTANLAGRA